MEKVTKLNRYNFKRNEVYAGECAYCTQEIFWGAHACSVLVAAFCRNELLFAAMVNSHQPNDAKFAMAECHRQHARGVRSPEVPLAPKPNTIR
jgi:hypothetical protein